MKIWHLLLLLLIIVACSIKAIGLLGKIDSLDSTSITLTLNSDGMLYYKEISRGNYNNYERCQNCSVIMVSIIDKNENINDESIQVTDLNNKALNFRRVSSLKKEQCSGEYSYNVKSKSLEICLQNPYSNDFAYQLEYTFEPDLDIMESCRPVGVIAKNISFQYEIERFPKKLTYELLLGDKILTNWGTNCFFNKKPIRVGKSFVCTMTQDDAVALSEGKDIVNLDIYIAGNSEDYVKNAEEGVKEKKEKVTFTAKVLLSIIVATLGFFGAWRTRIKNIVYQTFRNGSFGRQIILLIAFALLVSFYCYFLIWWNGYPFV